MCTQRGHGGVVVIHSSPISEVCGSNPGPCVVKLVVAYTDVRHFIVQNPDQLHVLVSSVHKTTRRDITYTVLKMTLKHK